MITELEEKKPAAKALPPRKTTPSAPSHSVWDDEEPEVSGFKKWRIPVIIGILLAGGIGFVAHSMSKKTATPPPKMEPMKVTIEKFTPPPPPPPPQQQQVEEKKQEQMIEEVKQEEAQPEPANQVETALKGDGNSGMVLKSGNGSGVFNRGNTVSAERMRWSAYAGQVKVRIGQLLESHPKTRKMSSQIVVHVWLDETGRVTRSTLDGSTGDSAMDAAIRGEILPGMQISGPPPQGMPMPINMRITGRRPN